MLEVDGTDHAPWATEPDRVLTEVEEFLTGGHAAPSQSHRALRTVLFTDIVASTERAAATGDERWRAVLHRFGEITTDVVERFGGDLTEALQQRTPPFVTGRRSAFGRRDDVGEQHGAQGTLGL